MTILALNNSNTCMSVTLRQSLVMSVMMGDNYSLPSDMFSSEVVLKLVSVVTGICPEQIFFSGMTEIFVSFLFFNRCVEHF